MSQFDPAPLVGDVAKYYSGRLAEFGATPQGVDWNSSESQQLRFTQLLRVMDGAAHPTVIDYGCGYGALAERLIAEGRDFQRYVGYDAAAAMAATAAERIGDTRCRFTDRSTELGTAGFTFASGVFNVRIDTPLAVWREYVAGVLEEIAERSEQGFAFNMLTRYADPPMMTSRLYYADPSEYFALCKRRYSRDVALLHDYGLYEFTIIVRLGNRPVGLADAGH